MTRSRFEAEPYPLEVDPGTTGLIIIDMQRDFLEPGGFGEFLGNDVSLLRSIIEPCRRFLDVARAAGLTVIHTREGHQSRPLGRAADQARPRPFAPFPTAPIERARARGPMP